LLGGEELHRELCICVERRVGFRESGGELLTCEEPWWELPGCEEISGFEMLSWELTDGEKLRREIPACERVVGFEGFGGELLTSEGLLRELPACVKCEADFEEFGGYLPACEEPCCETFGFEEDLSSEELCFVFSGS
jgi:hypothetical protein